MELRRFVISIVSRFDPKGFEQADARAARLKAGNTGAARATDDYTRSTRAASRATRETGEAASQTSTKVSDLGGRLSSTGGSATSSSKALAGMGSTLRSVGAAGAVMVGVLGAVAAGVAAVAIPVISTGIEFEQLKTRLTTLLGSTEAADDAFGQIQTFAAKTPFSLQQVTKSFIDLKTRGVDVTAERLTALGDISSAFGYSIEQMAEAVGAAARGELDSIEKFGIGAEFVGNKVSLTFQGQKIQVDRTAEAITGAVAEFGKLKGIAGAMEAQSKTLAGQLSNAQDSLAQFMNTAAQSGPMERVSEILKELNDRFGNAKNAKLLGQAIDQLLTVIRDALRDVDPDDVTAGFQILVDVLKLLAFALKPLLWLFRQMVGVLGAASTATGTLVEVTEAFTGVLSGALSLGDGVTKLGEAFGFMNSEAENTGEILNGLRETAKKTLDAIKAAVTGAIAGSMSNEELAAVIADPNASPIARKKAIEESNKRQRALIEEGQKVRQKAEQRFDATTALDKAAADVGEATANDEFKRLRKAGVSEEAAKKQASVIGAGAEKRERARLGEGGKVRDKKKGKGDEFFQFEEEIKKAAKSQAEDFAQRELENLIAGGLGSDEAIAKARASGKARAKELEEMFRKAGKVFDASSKNILDILGLNGPGSVLENRPPPQTLLITIAPTIKMIERMEIHVTGGSTPEQTDALNDAANQAREAVMATLSDVAAEIDKMFGLQAKRLVEAHAGGRKLPGME